MNAETQQVTYLPHHTNVMENLLAFTDLASSRWVAERWLEKWRVSERRV